MSKRGPRRPTGRPSDRSAGPPGATRGGLVDRRSPALDQAQGSWEAERRDEALELYDRALREEPDNIRAYADAALAYGRRYRLDRARELLARLRALAPEDPRVHHAAGGTFERLQLTDDALACFERAGALAGATPAVWAALANQYERSHRLEEAAELAGRALAAQPGQPRALLIRSRVERRRTEDERAEATLRSLIAAVPAGAEIASMAWAELALLRDRQGRYHEAFEAIERCKQPLRERSTAHLRSAMQVQGRFAVLFDSLTAADLARWRDEAAALPPQRTAVLTGFPRSGTTLLEQVLDAHPDLVSSEERDVMGAEVFRSFPGAATPDTPVRQVLDELTGAQIGAARRAYLDTMESMLDAPIDGRMHLDKNPAFNLLLPVMARLLPETRVLVALRDPRDVVTSCYLRYLPVNPLSVRFLSLAGTADRYAFDMRCWLAMREIMPAPWCAVRYEDAVDDLAGVARRLLETLGLAWDPGVLAYRDRLQEKRVRSPTYEAVARPVHRGAVERWRHYEKHLAPVLDVLEPFVREFGYS